MILTAPLMLLGLLALPLLATIYWFRRRSRRVAVSSLMLWIDQRRPREGGRFVHRMQTPLTFFLELLAIALLAIAAAGPAIVRKDSARPLIVVLDDSYSMLAHEPNRPSPRRQAETALAAELARDRYATRYLLAGTDARLLSPSTQSNEEDRQIPAAWTCQSAWADLQRGIAVARELGGPTARILVLSDQPPPMKLAEGQVQWWAFGSKVPNMALTAAVRSATADNERALLEVTNLSDASRRTTLTLEGGNLASTQKMPIELAAGASRQFFFDLPAGSPLLKATLDDDALEIDNKVVLLPESTRPLRVRVDLADAALRRSVVRVLEATGTAIMATERPDLVVCDHAVAANADAWRLEILGGKDAVAYAGPFVIDRTHALAQGLSLDGTIWSALPQAQLSGLAIITAGNVTLMTDREEFGGEHHLQMNFAAGLSNVQDMPDWPILFANLLRWRRDALVGPQVRNVRLGQTVTVTLPENADQVELTPPAGSTLRLKAHNRRVEALVDRVGLYTVKAPGGVYQFACNAVSRDESDLSGGQTGSWGDWSGPTVLADRQISLRWAFLLLSMACLAGHLAVVANKGVQGSGFGSQDFDSKVDRTARR